MNFRRIPSNSLCEAADLPREHRQPVGVEVELCELRELPDGGREVLDGRLGKVQHDLVLLLALGELPGKVLQKECGKRGFLSNGQQKFTCQKRLNDLSSELKVREKFKDTLLQSLC